MSNQTGDRYTCSDPDCGCEIEVKQPCNALEASDMDSDVTPESEEAIGETSQLSREGSVATPGDYGSQGATGEGLFGTSGSGSVSGTRQGRYGSNSPRRRSESSSAGESASDDSELSQTAAPMCFCGSEMVESGAGKSRTMSAGA